MITLNRVYTVTDEHLIFVQAHSGNHITQDTYNRYESNRASTNHKLIEARNGTELVGISFASETGNNWTYSMTVVHKAVRGMGISKQLLGKILELLPDNVPLVSQVAITNTASVKLVEGFPHQTYDNNGKIIYILTKK